MAPTRSQSAPRCSGRKRKQVISVYTEAAAAKLVQDESPKNGSKRAPKDDESEEKAGEEAASPTTVQENGAPNSVYTAAEREALQQQQLYQQQRVASAALAMNQANQAYQQQLPCCADGMHGWGGSRAVPLPVVDGRQRRHDVPGHGGLGYHAYAAELRAAREKEEPSQELQAAREKVLREAFERAQKELEQERKAKLRAKRREQRKAKKRRAMECAIRSKLRKEDEIYGVDATLDRIPGAIVMDKIVPHLEARELLYLATTCTHFSPFATRRVVVPESIFDPASILKTERFEQAIRQDDACAYHATPISLNDFVRLDVSVLMERSAKFRDWHAGLPKDEQNRLRELGEQARRLREEEDKQQICLMPEWMVKELEGEVARNSSGKKLETECFFSTDANAALRHCLLKKARAAQIKRGLNLLVLDKAEVKASFARQVGLQKYGPRPKGRGTPGSEHFGVSAIPAPVKDAYLLLGAGGPEPQFICYFRDGKFLDVDVPGLEGGAMATTALEEAIESAVRSAEGIVDPVCLQRAIDAGFSRGFVLERAKIRLEIGSQDSSD
ncbi:hypothetical protein ACHAXT_009617 [Thalassiosira profunda]